jgi:hypothetical protein
MGLVRTPLAFLLSAMLANSVSATTYFSEGLSGLVAMGGDPQVTQATATFGETFTLTERSTLNDWSFMVDASGFEGNVRFEIARWAGLHAIGPTLFESIFQSDGRSNLVLSATSIGLTLDAGTYVAILTTAGVDDRLRSIFIWTTAGAGNPLPGLMVLANTQSTDPVAAGVGLNWSLGADIGLPGAQLWYRANITSAVPEAGSVYLALCGMAVLGLSRARMKPVVESITRFA